VCDLINDPFSYLIMQKIIPHLWFDKEAEEAAEFYVSIFRDAEIKNRVKLRNTPSGSAVLVALELFGQEFNLISADPYFKLNPSVSFLVACDTMGEVDAFWGELTKRGVVRMGLGEYPFSEKYGWVEDRYGVSWQLMFTRRRGVGRKITPTLMFVGGVCGRAEEAVNFYASVFHDAKIGDILRYGKGVEPDREGTVQHVAFTLEGQEFAAMDSARMHGFSFNEAISFVVKCESQGEVDYYWGKLSADPNAEQCGWLKDKYGLSWQVVPTIMDEMLRDKDDEKITRVTEAFLKMKKFDVEALKRAL